MVSTVKGLNSLYAKKEITYVDYKARIDLLLEHATVQEWLNYYDRLIAGYQEKIKEITEKIDSLERKGKTKNIVVLSVMMLVLAMIGIYAYTNIRAAGEAAEVSLVNVTIINIAPNVTTTLITPPMPDTLSNLTCLAESVFDMNEDEVVLYYRWFNNSLLVESLNNLVTVTSWKTAAKDNWTCEITPFDGIINGTPKNASVIIAGVPVTLEEWMLTPLFPYTVDNLTLTVLCTDADSETLTAYWNIYRNLTLESSASQSINNSIETNITVVATDSTSKSERWMAEVWCGDNESNTSKQNTSTILIQNTPPIAALRSPTNGNDTLFDRKVTFNYTSTDEDLDAVTYELNISTFGSTLIIERGITSSYFTLSQPLEVSTEYQWSVRAYDGEEYSSWSGEWNFSIAEYIIIRLMANQTSFGDVDIGVTADTIAGPALPFVIENMGNVEADIVLLATEQLFDNAELGTEYLRYMADESIEIDSFNWTGSQITWSNVTADYTPVIDNLKYEDVSDTAEIEFQITVPPLESSGEKRTTISVGGESSE